MSVIGITTKGNPEQAEELRLIMDNDHPIVAVTGDAGTGKNFVAIATAMQLILDKRYSKIYYARNPVQVGESIGYLPGTEKEKLEGFMSPLHDTAEQLAKKGKMVTKEDILNKIEVIPIYSLRGRTLDNCVLIVDECQNFNVTELKTILTRMGRWSKLVLLGSMNQIDAKRQNKKRCDFERVIEALENEVPEFAHVHLIQSMRAPWCVKIDQLLSELEQN